MLNFKNNRNLFQCKKVNINDSSIRHDYTTTKNISPIKNYRQIIVILKHFTPRDNKQTFAINLHSIAYELLF